MHESLALIANPKDLKIALAVSTPGEELTLPDGNGRRELAEFAFGMLEADVPSDLEDAICYLIARNMRVGDAQSRWQRSPWLERRQANELA